MSCSSISAPQAHSLTVIGAPRPLGFGLHSNSNSAIISSNKEKEHLIMSQSPKKTNVPTYFSQYLEPIEDNPKLIKKPTTFTFANNNQ